jgi:trans-AT polyketide synthase, acyltransferase and oxidoreductase domains
MITYVFPGQGSQQKGMGKELFDKYAELVFQVNDILGYSIKELCLEDPELKLSFTQYTQPALYIVNALSYLQRIETTDKKPDYVAGHSLGEYNALFAAGVFDFATGLKMVKKRGELMSLATGGGMAAVIGLNEEQIKDVLINNQLQNIDIANYNSPYQIVISGPSDSIQKAKPIFEAVKDVKTFIPLKVSGAFHSRYMENTKKEFAQYLDSFDFLTLTIPVISNVYARPYKQANIKQWLLEQLTNPVKWTESIRYLMGKAPMEFEEIGAGKILTGMIKRIQNEAEPLIVKEEETELNIASNKPLNDGLLKEDSIEKPDKTKEKTKSQTDNNNFRKALLVTAESLGSLEFKKEYNVKFAYLTGAMYRGVASKEMVVKMGKAGLMGFLGTGGMDLETVEAALKYIKQELNHQETYGMNLLSNLDNPEKEERMIELYFKYDVHNIEAAAFMMISHALVRFRLKGLRCDPQGNIIAPHRIIGKISRPETAELFLSPAPERIVTKLLQEQRITAEEAELSKKIPMACDLCVEADSGGHTDQGVAYVLMPAILKLRDDMMGKYKYDKKIRVGAAGGIGTPNAALAAFMLGADFVVTGSINQCTVEAGTSDRVKDLLQQINVQDTAYAPAGDMFELGAKVQVLKRGVFFPARANKLYDLYRQYNSIDEIDEKTKAQIQEKYFRRSFTEVYKEVKAFYPPQEIAKADQNPKYKMSLIFRWYFGYCSALALNGDEEGMIDYQVHCGPALGAFNQWVKGTDLENWHNRHVDEIGIKLLQETAAMLNQRIQEISA